MRYRVGLLSCLGAGTFIASAAPQPGLAAVRTIRVASGLSLPVFVTSPPGDTQRLFVLEQHTGNIRIIKNGTVLPTPFLTVPGGVTTGEEQGLLGLAFHPQYVTNRRFYINYTTTGGGPAGQSIVAEYQASTADPDLADTSTGRVILHFDQPQTNHNCGWMAFGPSDGYLYIGTGDGGGAGDDDAGHTVGTGNAQDITDNWLGKILRVDVNGDDFPADTLRNYAIPPNNPFVGVDGDDEIWAYGLRNPWRCAFDRANTDLYIADVGQNLWEEVDYQPAASAGGQNYGWRLMEGSHCYNPPTDCDPGGLTYPVYEYPHNPECAIIGGYVYRGSTPEIQGRYFFADLCSAKIWSFRIVAGAVTELTDRTAELSPGGGLSITSISSFGEDANGELYICDLDGGEVFEVVGDTDGDGVLDQFDLCPNTIPGVTVDANGCPPVVPGDLDRDGDVDGDDLTLFESCASGPGIPDDGSPTCQLGDLHPDGSVDQSDFSIFQRCVSGANVPGNPNCAN